MVNLGIICTQNQGFAHVNLLNITCKTENLLKNTDVEHFVLNLSVQHICKAGNDDHDRSRSMIAIITMIDDRFWMMTIIDRNTPGIVCQNHLKFGVLRVPIGDS